MNSTILDCLYGDDAIELRLLAYEHIKRPGILGDMARYLVCVLDDRERCLRAMEQANRNSAIPASEARRRRRHRVDIPGGVRRPIHAEPKRFRPRPMPMPISDKEVEAML